MTAINKRHALRVAMSVPTVVESIGQPALALPAELSRVYERVENATERVGERLPGVLRDLSTNGAFIAGDALPLLSRVAFGFELSGFGTVQAVGWTLWRRTEDCNLTRPDGQTEVLPRGFGVLFEAIPLDARLAIHRQVTRDMS